MDRKRLTNFNYKKAEMGVGTLIVFIAMLLVAAVAAGVLIQTVSSLQEKSLSTGQQARSQISTNAMTIEVSATDGRNSTLTDFNQLMKLSPGSDPIKLEDIIFTFNTKDATATLKYDGTSRVCKNNCTTGYYTIKNVDVGLLENNTLYNLEEDIDGDCITDSIRLVSPSGDDAYITFELSDAGNQNISLNEDISNASTTPVSINLNRQAVIIDSETYAYITISGSTDTNDTLPASMDIIVEPYDVGKGVFAVEYEQRSTNWVDGNLQRGDIIKMCYEAPEGITEDVEVKLNFIPKIGTATLTLFTTPDVISTQRTYLYP